MLEPLRPTTTPPEIQSFDHWALDPAIQAEIAGMGITQPTPIQALAIQPVLERRDVIAQAETGTGKTLAFGAPMVSLIDPARVSVLGLVLCPTRELAEQVAGVLTRLGAARGVSVALIVGGEEAAPQVQALQAGAQIVVGTPGRVLDLYRQRFLSFPWTEFVVLDEADEMLEIGFIDDVREILSKTPDERQTLLFSATFPSELLRLARECTKEPVEVATALGVATVTTIEQEYFEIMDEDRPLALIRLIEQSEPDDVLLVFCERRTEVERLMRRLERLPYSIKALHGGYDQAARFRVMGAFRDRDVKALVATDVASRGLDVLHVTHVVNFSVPRDVTSYTHRIGRTGRAGRQGKAVTLVTPASRGRWRAIVRAASWEIREVEPPGRGARRPAEGRRGSADERGSERAQRPQQRVEREPERRVEREREPRRPAEREREPQPQVDAEAPRRPRAESASGVERRGAGGRRSERGAKDEGRGEPREEKGLDVRRGRASDGAMPRDGQAPRRSRRRRARPEGDVEGPREARREGQATREAERRPERAPERSAERRPKRSGPAGDFGAGL